MKYFNITQYFSITYYCYIPFFSPPHFSFQRKVFYCKIDIFTGKA